MTFKSLANRINNVVNGTFIPTTLDDIHFSCGFGKKEVIDNLAQGSTVAITKNQVFNRTCWKCKNEYQVKGLRYDDECPRCGQRSNNPEFPKILHENFHMNEALRFSGLAKNSPPIPASTSALVPRINHEDIYHNSDRVANASNGPGSGNNNTYKQRQQMIDRLNRILGLTYSSRGLL